jgi:hypothetical protein
MQFPAIHIAMNASHRRGSADPGPMYQERSRLGVAAYAALPGKAGDGMACKLNSTSDTFTFPRAYTSKVFLKFKSLLPFCQALFESLLLTDNNTFHKASGLLYLSSPTNRTWCTE